MLFICETRSLIRGNQLKQQEMFKREENVATYIEHFRRSDVSGDIRILWQGLTPGEFLLLSCYTLSGRNRVNIGSVIFECVCMCVHVYMCVCMYTCVYVLMCMLCVNMYM